MSLTPGTVLLLAVEIECVEDLLHCLLRLKGRRVTQRAWSRHLCSASKTNEKVVQSEDPDVLALKLIECKIVNK